ncbi:MAG: bactofilin family protein [Anaerolineaceae bacterium]
MVSILIKRKFSLIFFALLLILLFFIVRTNYASGLYQDGIIGEDEVIADDLFINSPLISVDGKIQGIFLAIGKEITINQNAILENDVYILAQKIVIHPGARLMGNVTLVAQTIEIDTTIDRNFYGASATLKLGSNTIINNDLFYAGFQIETAPESSILHNLYAAAYQSILSGTIHQNLRLAVAALDLQGIVSGNADILLDLWSINDDSIRFWQPYLNNFGIPEPLPIGFRISDKARIEGQLVYSSNVALEEALSINPSGGVIVRTPSAGDQQFSSQNKPSQMQTSPLTNHFLRSLRLFFSLLLCGILTIWIFPSFLNNSAVKVGEKPLHDFGIGLVTSITVYIGLFVLFLFLVISAMVFGLLSIGLLGNLFFGLGLVSLGWICLFFTILVKYTSKIVVAFWLGKMIMEKSINPVGKNNFLKLIVGILLFVLGSTIPFIGWLISVSITWIGLGAMWYVLQSQNRFPFLKWKA